MIGVSPDKLPPIEKFAAKYKLTFPLASDAEKTAAVMRPSKTFNDALAAL